MFEDYDLVDDLMMPDWAVKDKNVVELCKKDELFYSAVFNTPYDETIREILKRHAKLALENG